jgi:hypothetical protein
VESRVPGHRIVELDSAALADYVEQWLPSLGEEEALAVLDNPFCTAAICQRIARAGRLTSLHSVRLRLVTHRATPRAEAMRLVPFLNWPDLLRLSNNVQVWPQIRRAAEARLGVDVERMTIGERISTAKVCSRELIRTLLFDRDRRVFASLLINPRLTEDDLMRLLSSDRAGPEILAMIADDPRWGQRYAVRMALVMNPATPKAAAASQLRFLRRTDLSSLASSPRLSLFLKRCIERLSEP